MPVTGRGTDNISINNDFLIATKAPNLSNMFEFKHVVK